MEPNSGIHWPWDTGYRRVGWPFPAKSRRFMPSQSCRRLGNALLEPGPGQRSIGPCRSGSHVVILPSAADEKIITGGHRASYITPDRQVARG
jgi:hypothetical protein